MSSKQLFPLYDAEVTARVTETGRSILRHMLGQLSKVPTLDLGQIENESAAANQPYPPPE